MLVRDQCLTSFYDAILLRSAPIDSTFRVPRRAHRQGGDSLLESLVALFVFAVGALGIAALQTTALIHSDDMKQRSMAIWKAQELVERVRAHGGYADQGRMSAAYQKAVGQPSLSALGKEAAGFRCPSEVAVACTAGATCSIEDQARYDVWSVFCDPETGLQATLASDEHLDVVFMNHGSRSILFIEWAHHPATAAKLNDVTLGESHACDQSIGVEASLGLYCVAF